MNLTGCDRHRIQEQEHSRFLGYALKKSTALWPFGQHQEHPVSLSIYSCLLSWYLEHFLPRDKHSPEQKWLSSTAHSYRPSTSVVFLGIIQEFWLSDVDEPLSVGQPTNSTLYESLSRREELDRNLSGYVFCFPIWCYITIDFGI